MGWRLGTVGFIVLAMSLFVAQLGWALPVTRVPLNHAPAVSDVSDRIEIEVEVNEDGLCATQPNLLQNRSFEGDYEVYVPPNGHPQCPDGVCTSVRTAPNWSPWWTIHDDSEPEYIIRMPEFTAAEANFWYGPERTRSGNHAQQYFTLYSTHEAGVYQQVSVQTGEEYCFSAWGHSWSAQDDPDPLNTGSGGDALSGPEFGQMWQKVGIDPTGGTDWTSSDIVWSDQETSEKGRHQYDVNGLFLITATAQAETMTVFIYSQPDFAVKHNNVYWDDATLSLLPSPSVAVAANPSVGVLTTVTDTVQINQTVLFAFDSLVEPVSWTAVLSAGHTIMPIFTASGSETEGMAVSVDTSGLGVGIYTAEIVVTTAPEIDGSPLTIPIRVVIAERIYTVGLSRIQR